MMQLRERSPRKGPMNQKGDAVAVDGALAGAGCLWLLYGAYVTFTALTAAAVSVVAFVYLFPWAMLCLAAGLLLLIKPSARTASFSLVAGTLSLAGSIYLWLSSSPEFRFETTMLVLVAA